MEKTRLEDLFKINYRFGGLTEMIPETHQTVLAKRTKDMVRSIKGAGGVYV
jgi:DNA-binding HxlR family transcriptional regulator